MIKGGYTPLCKTLILNSVKYKYQLDSSSKKDVCPQCRKRRFVRMIDELGNYLSAEFGRCDRSNSCGYYKSPQNSDSYVKLDFTLPNVVNLTRNVGPPSTIPLICFWHATLFESINLEKTWRNSKRPMVQNNTITLF